MSKRLLNSLYYADDRDIYDLLMSSVRHYSIESIIKIARDKGIFLSREESRENLAKTLSSFPYGWNEATRLLKETESPDRREMVTSSTHITDSDLSHVKEVAETIGRERGLIQDEIYNVTAHPSGNSLRVQVSYTDPDFSKNRILQRREKQIYLEIQRKDGDLHIRREANHRSNEIFKEILQKLKFPGKIKDQDLHDVISLESCLDPSKRTNFFLGLMYKMEEFSLHDIVYLDVDIINKQMAEDDEDEEGAGADRDDEHLKEMTKEAKDLIGIVSKASLHGTNLLVSNEYKQMKDRGFFISHCVWKSSHDVADGKLVEFHAQFADSANGKDFKFSIRGIYNRFKNGDFQKTKCMPSDEQLSFYLDVLEEAAKEAFTKIDTPIVFAKKKISPNGKGKVKTKKNKSSKRKNNK